MGGQANQVTAHARRPQNRQEEGAALHVRNGDPCNLPKTEPVVEGARRPGGAMPADERGDHEAQPGLVDWHHLHPDEAWVHVPYGSAWLAHEVRGWLGAWRHALHPLLH